MKRSIEVQTHAEGDALVRAMDDPVMRATVLIGGALAALAPAERRLVLGFVTGREAPRDATPLPRLESHGVGRLHDAAAVAVGRSTGE